MLAEQGFKYQPVMSAEAEVQVLTRADEKERVRTRGFGITTWYGYQNETQIAPDRVDPNQELLEGSVRQ